MRRLAPALAAFLAACGSAPEAPDIATSLAPTDDLEAGSVQIVNRVIAPDHWGFAAGVCASPLVLVSAHCTETGPLAVQTPTTPFDPRVAWTCQRYNPNSYPVTLTLWFQCGKEGE